MDMDDERLIKYIDGLSRMINVPTISDTAAPNGEAFAEFHRLIREMFPRVFDTFEYEEFHGSILLSHIVKCDADPVLFMSHHDVVPENGDWTHKPFCATVDGGKLYGRGTLDTKGDLWAILTSLEELLEEGYEFGRSIYVESACNEETTQAGANEIADVLKKRGVRFDFTMDEGGMISRDPTGISDGEYAMVALGEKDCIDLRFVARSCGGHSSTPDKHNPLSRLAKFIVDVEKHDLFKPMISPVTIEMFGKLSQKMSGMQGFVFRHAGAFRHILAKKLPQISTRTNSMVRTTLCFTKAKGSDACNVIPTEAYVIGNMRRAHHDDKDEIMKKLGKIAKKYDVEIIQQDPGYGSAVSDCNTAQFRFLEQTIAENFPGVVTIPFISTGASDSKFFSELSDNVFRFAPFRVSGEQLGTMHAKDENIDVSALIPAVEFYKSLIKKL